MFDQQANALQCFTQGANQGPILGLEFIDETLELLFGISGHCEEGLPSSDLLHEVVQGSLAQQRYMSLAQPMLTSVPYRARETAGADEPPWAHRYK